MSENKTTEERAQDSTEDTRRERSFAPDVDIVETDEAIVMHVDMPGVTEAGVEVRLEDDVLSLVGTISKDDYEGLKPVYTEYSVGNYRRRFSISSEVSGDKIEGKMSNGVLELVLPKVLSAQPRQIPITSG